VRRVRPWLLAPAALVLGAAALRAQGQSDPCRPGGGNRALRAQLTAGRIPRLRFAHEIPVTYQQWATSMRVPPGAGQGVEDPFDRAAATCGYGAGKVRDGDSATCWCEGAAGPGVGELVLTKVDPAQPIDVRAGDQRSDSAWAASNRPRRVRVTILSGEDFGNPIEGEEWRRLRVLGRHIVELRDTTGWQPLRIPVYLGRAAEASSDEERALFVAIEILSVYRGREGVHTCIAEVEAHQR
jgi:hypothetical protein